MVDFTKYTDAAVANAGAASAPMALRFAAPESPDKAAEANALARRYGLPPAVAEAFAEDYKARALSEDGAEIVKRAPRLGSWIAASDMNAKVSHDDLQTLGGIEEAIAKYGELKAPRAPEASFSTIASGLFDSVGQGYRLMREGARMQVGDMLGLPIEDAQRRYQQEQARAQASSPEFESETARGLYGGGVSTLRMLPGTIAAIATRNPSLALVSAGLQTETEAYGKYRTRGATAGEALAGASGEGAVEVATEMIPMGFLVDKFGKTGAKEFLSGMLLREMPTEQLATFLQDAIDTAVANPDKTWGEFFAERPAAAYQTALGVLVQSSIFGAANTVANRMSRGKDRADRAEEAAAQIEQLSKLAEASKLRGRDAESFRDFVQQVSDEQGDAPAEFYVDAKTLVNTLDQSGITMAELQAVAPAVAQQIEAAATGGDIRIPVSEFLSAKEAITSPLIDHLRTAPDAMSRAEAKEYLANEQQRMADDLERELQGKVNQDEFRKSVTAIRDQFAAELDAAKRFTPDVNKAYAELLSSFYGAQAVRMGMRPEELLNRYRLRVQSNMGGGDKVLNQGDILDLGDLESLMQIPGMGDGVQANASGESAASLEAQSRLADEKARGRRRVMLDVATGRVTPLVGVDAVDTAAGPGKLVLQRGVGANDWTVLSAGAGVTRNAAMAAVGRGQSAGSLNQPVFHGSPHTFEAFSLDNIGSGEGAQAYGWGLYFAENREIAKGYFHRLSNRRELLEVRIGSMRIGPFNGFDYSRRASESTLENIRASFAENLLIDEAAMVDAIEQGRFREWALEQYDQQVADYQDEWPDAVQPAATLRKMLEAPGALTAKIAPQEGGIYSVEIPDAAIEKMLLWDEPIDQQPRQVQEAIRQALKDWGYLRPKDDGPRVFSRALKALMLEHGSVTNKDSGEAFYKAAEANLGSDKAASEYLDKLGIPGLRYWDGGSRSQGSGTRNVVVWNQPTIDQMNAQVERKLEQSGGEAPRAQIALPNDITASPSVISLLEGADLSSFIHESGHFFLEVQADLAIKIQQQIDSGASVSDGERGIVEDMNRLLEWFGVKGNESISALDEWAGMTLEEKRVHHEQFARGFEAYAFEGKAPSAQLQGIFQRFRSWLMQVYKTLRGLNVELTDDVRGVMDRMLATDMQIEEAEAARNLGPLFKSAEDAGMTLEEFNAYQALARKATDGAIDELTERSLKDMKWLGRARDKALKARQQEVDDLRRQVRQEVTAEVMTEPVYQAWQFLTSKSEDATEAGKLRTDELREMYGIAEDAVWRKLSALRMTSDTTGRSPETVAEDFGFDSGDALVQALANSTPPSEVIEARTDQRMLERYGDITSREALERAADEAVHNEARARFLADELKALEKANRVREGTGKRNAQGREITRDALLSAAKDYAAQIIGRQRVRDLRPGQYAAAAARSAKLAEKALRESKTAEAAMHKRNQLVNHYAAKAAYDAQAEVKRYTDYFRRFDKRPASVDPGYLDQIDAMLERFDFKPVSLKEVDRRKSLSAWYAEQVEMGNVPAIPDELLNEANRKSYKDMTLDELRGLRDTVRNIEHLGKLKNRLLLARDKRTFDAAAEQMAQTIRDNGGKPREVKLEGEKGLRYWLEGVAAMHRKLSSYFRQMDGGRDDGPMFDLIGRAMNERGAWEDTEVEKATVRLMELYKPLLKMRGGISGARSKLFIPEINASLTRGGRLAVALNWGNADNRQRILDGDKWNEGQVRAILKTLTAEELQFVNNVWEFLDSYWPAISEKEKRLTGVAPEKVKAEPFVTTSADGIEVSMRGGYYPLKYDSDRSDRAQQQEAAQVAKDMMRGALTRSTTQRGHTKERLQEVKRPVRKDLNVITQHVKQVVHDLAWHEWLIDTNRLLRDERVVEAIREHHGPKVLKTMRDDVAGIATADVMPQTDVDKALLLMRSNVSRATMGASLTTAFLQPFGLTQSMVRIGSKHVMRGAARWAGDAARMESTMAWIHDKSEFMRLRSKTFNREIREINAAVAGKSAAMRAVDGGLFWLMQKMQLVADVPTWIGQYEKTMAEGPAADTEEARAELEARAIAQADRAVIEAQGSGQAKDLAEVQRKHPMLTQFYSYFSVTLNLVAERTANTEFQNPRAVAGWLGDMALLLVIPAILPSMLMYFARGGGDGDDEGDLAKKIAKWQLGYLMSMVVGIREGSGMLEGFDYAGPPVGRIVSDIKKAGDQTAQGEVDEPLVLAYARLIGTAFGLPVVQVLRSYKGWKAWDEGQQGAGPQSVLVGPPPKD